MKAKLTKLSAALILAGLAGGAQAAIDDGQLGNGELYMEVWDSVSQTSYTRDLGVYMNDWLDNEALGSTGVVTSNAGFAQTWGTDAVWTTFTSGMTAAQIAGLVWDVTASDTNGSGANGQRYLSTSLENVQDTANDRPTNNNVAGYSNVAQNHVGAVNNLEAGGVFPCPACQDLTAEVSLIATPADGFAYFNTNNRGSDWGTATSSFLTTATIGTAMNFFYITNSGGSLLNKALVLRYDNGDPDGVDGGLNNNATWLLGADGSLSYQIAAVPEAETWALLGLGLVGLGFYARRRTGAAAGGLPTLA